jgi:tRNA pseudouridine32 synthase/23S rRNA pseudouridine746 synthase
MDIPILFLDQRFVVLDKPAGLAVHPGPRGGASVEDVFPRLSRRKDGPWLAHRLDADTAGCLVVALRKAALIAAQAEFTAGRVEKTYWAVCAGGPVAESGTIEAPLLRRSDKAGWRMVADAGGQAARTDWRVLGLSLIHI